MVKVREDQPLTADGRVDIDQWVARLQDDVKLADADELVEACQLAQSLEQASERPHKSWLKDGSSFRMGLEMADILGELRLDQTAIEAAVLYRAVRENLIKPEQVAKRFGREVASLIEGVLQMAAISNTQVTTAGLQ